MSNEPALKPHRPFGLTLAILVGVIFYSVIPLFITIQFLLVESHMNNVGKELNLGEETVQEIASGGDLTGGVTRFDMIVQAIMAFAFIGIAFFAWRGKPRVMRHIFTWSVILISVASVVVVIFPTPIGGMSGGSLDGLAKVLQPSVFAFYVLLPLYVVWYLNRAPARAFYRGYYLPKELELFTEMEK